MSAADVPDDVVRAATAAVLARLRAAPAASFRVRVGVSGRHVHLAVGDLATLFGAGYKLTVARTLCQPGQFAAAEAVTVIGPGGSLGGVRVVGPARSQTAVELSAGDCAALGLDAGVGAGKPFPVVLAGPAGVLRLPEAGVISRRHLHATPADAARFGLADGASVAARLGVAGRTVAFGDVWVRVAETAALELHIDRDEANACGARTGDEAEIIVGDGPAVSVGAPVRRTKVLITEADVVRAYKRGVAPDIHGAVVTPSARDALRKYFPEIVA